MVVDPQDPVRTFLLVPEWNPGHADCPAVKRLREEESNQAAPVSACGELQRGY